MSCVMIHSMFIICSNLQIHVHLVGYSKNYTCTFIWKKMLHDPHEKIMRGEFWANFEGIERLPVVKKSG